MSTLPLAIRHLILLSFLLSLSRALVSPLLVLTLGRQLQLGAQGIGLLLGGVLLLATLFGLYAGFLVDRFDRRHLLRLALLLIAGGFVALPFSHQPWLAALALLLVESAFVLFGIAVKALMSDLLAPAARSRVFAMRYTLANVAFAVGPFLGSLLAGGQASWPFWVSAALTLACLPLVQQVPTVLAGAATVSGQSFATTLQLLRRDRVLVLFTLGSLLACVVHARFSDYLSMVLLQSHSDAEVLRWMSVLIACNALTVVTLQYPLGRMLRQSQLLRWIMLASVLLAMGLAGFMLSSSLWSWCLWMVLFTLGEIILVPAEFLYIDAIAPEAQKGSYYGAQNLANVGSALSPALSGLMLGYWPSAVLLGLMIALTLLGALLVGAAGRVQSRQSCAALPEAA